MRRALLGLVTFGLIACNAILGNEDHYTVVNPTAAGDAGKAGSSGAAGAAGISEGGAAGVGDEAGSGGAGEGGEGGEAGEAGSSSGGAGGGACVATGAEDCFNGKDDDCNGATDCADSACTASSTCVPDESGAELGTLLEMGSTCPKGYSAVTLHRGLVAEATCAGCTCEVASTYCTTSVIGHGSYACPGFQFMGPSYNMFTNSCKPISPGASVHHYLVQSYTDCTASGTATPSPAVWQETRTFCKADRVGRGGSSGSSCVPKATSGACARKTGNATCSGAYAMSTGDTWSDGLSDTRTCGACQCYGGYGLCSGATVQVFNQVGCTGTSASFSGAEGDECPLPFAPASGQVVGTPVANPCVPNLNPSGEIKEAGPSTVCCR